jgi:hypothetical protein
MNALVQNQNAKPELNMTVLNEKNAAGKTINYRRPYPHPFIQAAQAGLPPRGALRSNRFAGFFPSRIPAGVYNLYEGPIKVMQDFRLNSNLGEYVLFTEVNPVGGGEILYEGTDRFGDSEIYRESERGRKWTVYKKKIAGGSKRRSLKRTSKKKTQKKKKAIK